MAEPDFFTVRVRTLGELTVAVRDARRAAGMTQADLAKATGLTRPWISQFEHGRAPRASLDRILAMLRALEIETTLTYAVPPRAVTTPPEATPSGPESADGAVGNGEADGAENVGGDHDGGEADGGDDDDDEFITPSSERGSGPVRLPHSVLERVRERRAGYLGSGGAHERSTERDYG